MGASYERKKDLAKYDVRFIFREGDSVLVKQKAPGKLKARSLGPYTFCNYCGRKGVNAVVKDTLGRRYYVSAANLLPMCQRAERLDRFLVDPGGKAPDTAPDSTIAPSQGDSEPPPGTIVLGEWRGGNQ
jgi:hypothetical protein